MHLYKAREQSKQTIYQQAVFVRHGNSLVSITLCAHTAEHNQIWTTEWDGGGGGGGGGRGGRGEEKERHTEKGGGGETEKGGWGGGGEERGDRQTERQRRGGGGGGEERERGGERERERHLVLTTQLPLTCQSIWTFQIRSNFSILILIDVHWKSRPHIEKVAHTLKK